MLKKWIIRLSLIINLLLIVTTLLVLLNPTKAVNYWLNDIFERSESFYDSYPVTSDDIVFLGDSITAGGRWNEIFPGYSTKNRGIGGDTTTRILSRLKQVTNGKPKAIYLMVGTNDFTHGPSDRLISYQQYRDIVKKIKSTSSQSVIFLQSILPRGKGYQKEVEAFNKEIKNISEEFNLEYINLYPEFLQDDGSIMNELSNDELHLNGSGYQLWQKLLQTTIKNL